jgi:mannose-1-phosphate guanylyltransferase
MRALILAAGLGTRLRPLTNSTPKCLVQIGSEVLLGNWLRRLRSAGIERVLVNLHYLSSEVIAWVESSPFNGFVEFAYEKELLGTAGTIYSSRRFFQGESGLVIHGDNFCTFDIRSFIAAHEQRPSGASMSLVAFRTSEPEQCGILRVNERGVLSGYWEKSNEVHGNLANGGIYILSPEIVFASKGKKDFAGEVLPNLTGQVFVWEQTGPFVDIGTRTRLDHARSLAKLSSDSQNS